MGYTKNIGSNLITQVLKIVIGVLSGIVVARALGPAGQGYIAYILLVFNLVGSFGHLGMVNATMYFQKRKGLDRTALFSTNMNMLLLFSFGLSVFVFFSQESGLWLTDYNLLYIIGGVLLAAFTMINQHHQSWLIGDEKIIQNNQISIMVFLVKSAVIVACWLGGILSPALFFWITVVSMVVWTAFMQASVKERWLRIISVPILKAELGYGSIIWLASLFAYLHYRADQVMIKHMMGLSELGVYTVAVTNAELVFLLPQAINTALTARLYNSGANEDERMLLSRTLKLNLYLCCGLAMLGLGGSILIPVLYGKPYQGAVSVLLILLPGVVFASFAKVASPWFFTKGRPRVHLFITFITLILNICLNYLFIPKWGINGAALASTISYFVYGAFYPIVLIIKEGFSAKALFGITGTDTKLIIGMLRK